MPYSRNIFGGLCFFSVSLTFNLQLPFAHVCRWRPDRLRRTFRGHQRNREGHGMARWKEEAKGSEDNAPESLSSPIHIRGSSRWKCGGRSNNSVLLSKVTRTHQISLEPYFRQRCEEGRSCACFHGRYFVYCGCLAGPTSGASGSSSSPSFSQPSIWFVN